jgi:hypothetical protein
MDIHPPSGPTHSFKDFAIHILIVTIGIIIALGLEGAREAWKENKAVTEARRNLREELLFNQQHLTQDLQTVDQAGRNVDLVLTHLPELAKAPTGLRTQVQKISLGLYYFKTTAWDSALASGVISHMGSDEFQRFDEVYLTIKSYQEMQKVAFPDLLATLAYFGSHVSYGPSEVSAGAEKLITLKARIFTLQHVGEEFQGGLKAAVSGVETSH